jgi:trans-aconitate 2-methyltransferase
MVRFLLATVTTWEPQTYLRYADIRFRAGLDLIARIPKSQYPTIYDLGCGTGHLTRILADNFSNSQVRGIDSSPEMLAEARREFPTIRWQRADITTWRPPAPADLIYSNAALHWVPDHQSLLPSLLRHLRPGGILAVQVPRHFESPSHLGLKELVMQSDWRAKLEPLLLAPTPSPEAYWRWLSPHDRNLDLWETIYLQVLDGEDPVVNFMRGTALRPFLSVLSESDAVKFISAFAERMASAYPPQANGQTLFPFRRLFLVAQR